MFRIGFVFKLAPSLPEISKEYSDFNSKKVKAEMMIFQQVFKDKMMTVVRDPEKENHVQMIITRKDGSPLNPDEVPSFYFLDGKEGVEITMH